ncbi:MAG: hypothetical protein ACM3OH_14995 [Bacillota bacterium]|jgi:hypothetical protein
MRKWLGISGVDFIIQAAVTICVIGMFVGTPGYPGRDEMVTFGVTGLSVLVLAIRRHRALRRGELGETTGELGARQLAELDMRVSELEAAQLRVMELEERVDFAERLLTRRPEQVLPAGDEAGAS